MRKCFIFHDWEKWIDDKEYAGTNYAKKIIIQKRVCRTCGKIQLKKVEST